MNKYNKIGLMLGAFVLAFGLIASAQTALTANIVAPADGFTAVVGQSVSLNGTATGGTGTYASFRWAFSDGTTGTIGASRNVTFATAGTKTITLTVTDSNGDAAVASRNITVTEASVKPVISNIQAINITKTGVTITWTTNIPASSRVIYDTVSHSDITGQTAPNFGYAATTPETDVTTKVTSHSVDISGLNPGTKYYFRVISQS
ncbi:MAG TPA: PKD domain-containing protein [Candidatus Paceibacterota bacterium]|nr:PKD domain-containing protein [Candidatus Paceibacterota bacterium]